LIEDGKVLIKYQLTQAHEYKVLSKNIKPLDAPDGDGAEMRAQQKRKNAPARANIPGDAVCIYTDGASSGNPGPSGIGVLLKYGDHEKTISKYIGEATNNIAELEAIKAGLLAVRKRNKPVRVFTDSSYAHGLLAFRWKAKKNQALVARIRDIASEFSDLKFIKVKGHAGEENNERADELAVSAIKKRIG
jgi:ribonuclease HI